MAAPPSYGASNPNGGPPGYPVEKRGQNSAPGAPIAPSALYAAVLLSSSDRVRLLNFPINIYSAMDAILAHAWPPGIQGRYNLDYGGMEWKLRGRPWYGQGSEAVPSRRLLIHIFHGLALQGWHLAASTDLSKKNYDKDTLFFRAGPPIPRVFFSISFNETDKVRIIDSPNEELTRAFAQTIHCWSLGIQSEKEKEYGCYQLKLRGTPWLTSNGTQVSQARMLVLNVLTVMDNLGYELAACVDMSVGTGEDARDIDSWFFASKI